MRQHQDARVVKAAGEDSAEARERLRGERAELSLDQWSPAHWRSAGQDARLAQGLPAKIDPAVLREAGRLAAPYLT